MSYRDRTGHDFGYPNGQQSQTKTMKTTLEVQDVNACGCPNALHKALAGLQGIFGVAADSGRGTVTVEHTDEVTPEDIIQRLREAGYRTGKNRK